MPLKRPQRLAYLLMLQGALCGCSDARDEDDTQEQLPLKLLDLGDACATDAECSSELCATVYVDQDHDGYGTADEKRLCVDGSDEYPPFGFAFVSGDCCDLGGDLWLEAGRVFPEQTDLFTLPQTACREFAPFDYNCNGIEEAEPGIARIPRTEFEAMCEASFPACDMGGMAAVFSELPCGDFFAAPFCAPLDGEPGNPCITGIGPLTPPLRCN